MMNCYQFRNSISNFIDEDISFKKRQDFKQHLADCPNCRSMYESVLATRQSMRNFPRISVSENFNLNLRNRILADRNAVIQRSQQKSFSLNRIPSFAYGFAAAICAVVAGFFILQSQSGESFQSTPPPVVQQRMAQPPVTQPSKNAPVAPVNSQPSAAAQYTAAQDQPIVIDTLSGAKASEEPSLDYKQNYEDKIRTVKDQR
jgi:anti-sigma factor RsiW